MSKLLNAYNEMSQEEQDSLGKVSTRIREAGAHLVEIVEAVEYDESRIKVEFKTESGETAETTLFMTSSDGDAEKEAKNTRRALNALTFIANAVGIDKLQSVLSKSRPGTFTKKDGSTIPTIEFTALKGKKLYIITNTRVEADEKDANKVYVKQEVDATKFFDIKKRSGIEIKNNVEEGKTLDAVAETAKADIQAHYKHTENPAVAEKVDALIEQYYGKAQTSTTGVISDNSEAAATSNTDDI